MRRPYIENLPNSGSKKDILDWINSVLLSSGVNRIQDEIVLLTVLLLRIYKEKCQALLEFLTPEDASAALYFDGRSFSYSIVKIRRPKDFVDVALFFSVIPQLLVVNCNVPRPIPAIGAVTVDGWLEVAYVPRGLFKNVNGCVSDSSNLMYFWRIRYGCGIKSEDSAQLRKLQHQHKQFCYLRNCG
ncbi:hypothetical protein P3L10_012458 [Capsicum annuum]